MKAIQASNLSTVKFILQELKSTTTAPSDEIKTLLDSSLLISIQNGKVDLMTSLLEFGVNPNGGSQNGVRTFHLAKTNLYFPGADSFNVVLRNWSSGVCIIVIV